MESRLHIPVNYCIFRRLLPLSILLPKVELSTLDKCKRTAKAIKEKL
jgi:hypothetical protein